MLHEWKYFLRMTVDLFELPTKQTRMFQRRKKYQRMSSVHLTHSDKQCTNHPCRLFILPSLSISVSVSPALRPSGANLPERLARALCDHSVNTPIILSASASRYHPAVEMTPEGLTVQFSRNGWQLSRQRRCAQPASC